MKSPFQRIAALALCFTLTLGAFAYRPSEAKAVVGVDDAVVIGALLSAFAGGCGLIFSNNGMTSGELAQGLTDKWNEFKAFALETDTTFAGWLGYEDMDALLQAIVLSGGNALIVPRLVARKFADFTTWLTQNLGVTAGGEGKVAFSSDGGILSMIDVVNSKYNASFGTDNYLSAYPYKLVLNAIEYDATRILLTSSVSFDVVASSSSFDFEGVHYAAGVYLQNVERAPIIGYKFTSSSAFSTVNYRKDIMLKLYDYTPSVFLDDALDSRLSVFAPSYYKNPTIDLPTEGEEAANPTLSGVGDGTATTIEGLLQQILARLQANTLAPTLEVAGTETGGNTGTDEDAKPYLPYIPQIFEKIKELPGTLANIWESIKGIPAAIAEKIGAFFTTLWGWLQSIIDAITALPAAIAEKIGALFKPDEALLSEITDTFKGKFGFFSTLKQFGSDLFGMTPETEPPVIWVHLENAESKYGYSYGDKQKIFDMTWYQKYKASVDGLLSGFLWLGYLWLLFKRAPSILNGMQMDEDLRPPLLVGDVSSAPRLGAGDGSTMYRGDGFTMRDKGGRSK